MRVWPLRTGSFDFSQAFGCVTQIGGFYNPAPGCPREAPVVHTGIDLAAPQGTRFYAAASGWVTEAGLDRPQGLANTQIVIQHDGANDGYATEYLHWITTYVQRGDYVRAGQPLGEVGSVGYSTGPHLHFGVVDLDSGERLDPIRWLPDDRATGAYLCLAPGSAAITFDDVGKKVPDWADPSPPPAPTRQRVPENPPASARQATGTGGERSAAPASSGGRSGDGNAEAGSDGGNGDGGGNGGGADDAGGTTGGASNGNGDAGGAERNDAAGNDRTDGDNGDGPSGDGDRGDAKRGDADREGGSGADGEDRGGGSGDTGGADEPAAEEPSAAPASPWVPDLSAVPSLAPAQEPSDGDEQSDDKQGDGGDGNDGGRDGKDRERGG